MAGLDNGINFLFDDTESKLAFFLPFNPLKNPQLKEVLGQYRATAQKIHATRQ
jgi:hypothetical protein